MIIKLINKTGFAQIPNTTLRDKRLSLDTRGMLAEVLSYSTEFETSVESLMTLLGIGRKLLLRMTTELKLNGYLQIINIQGRNGQIIDKEWRFYAESQNEDFSNNYIRRNFKNYRNPNQSELFDDFDETDFEEENPSDQDAPQGNVGAKETAVEGHHQYLKQESSQNTDLKDLEKLSLSQTEANESESEVEIVEQTMEQKSQFSMSEILKYVQTLIQNGADIRNPQGYAFRISQSDISDAMILAALYPERLKETDLEAYGPPRQFSAEPCSVCYGAKMANPDGKGHRKCSHCQDEKGKPSGFEPLEIYRQKALDLLRSELDCGEQIFQYEDFYSKDDWIWLMEQLNKAN